MKKLSIKDIAKQAGVVPSTVSCVLNGKAKERRI
ncbi:MAG: LacI family DNA-binding transcriptional regulator, partial [Chitinophagaceae bacterium]